MKYFIDPQEFKSMESFKDLDNFHQGMAFILWNAFLWKMVIELEPMIATNFEGYYGA